MNNTNENNEKSITSNYNENVELMKNQFHYPKNIDFKFRVINIKSLNKEATLFFLNSIVDINRLEMYIVKPIMESEFKGASSNDILDILMKNIINSSSVSKVNKLKDIIEEITLGNVIMFIDGCSEAISIKISSFEHRSVEKPTIENILKGPKESFTESTEVNFSLIRKHIMNKDLITEVVDVGVRGSSKVFLMYLDDIVNPKLLEEIKLRINKIEIESLDETSILEQYIEDRPYSLIPSTISTERPDRVASFLKEGHVALFAYNGSMATVVPITFFTLFHTSEDMYQRWAYGNFIRVIRLFSCIVALVTPGFYMAVTTFHAEMMPADLVMATISAREKLPFPVFLEIVIMEVSFELIREAGVRIPTAVGPTIGIVGTLILGQAAVEANIISPVLVIVVSITGLASFAIPEMNLSYIIRIGRFIFLFVAAISGFYGLGLLIPLILAYLSTIESFGVPFFSPYTPYFPSSKDTVLRPIIHKLIRRPLETRPIDEVRAKDRSDG
ncbi:spore germination protein [Clostridium fungisolvens]|uniref:Spore germination protein n=1 Tax=Clostridium fungisolvens TaxID=1604897 RepID=A0A6V8SD52_9CLOT|nr:spore germination protein [Clostridium fungisolvens]GFP74761.1 hypothetical protein bsdtw1_00817 [Clostridium fungisolvens]